MWANSEDVDFHEKLLWFNVLRRAVFDYVLYKGSGKNRLRWQKACQYLFNDKMNTGDKPSFSEVCDLFGWEPDYIRKLTRTLQRGDLKKVELSKLRDDIPRIQKSRKPMAKRTEREDQGSDFLCMVLRWDAGASVPMMSLVFQARSKKPESLKQVFREERHASLVRPTAWTTMAT
jgi:hypothetical protein